MASLFGTLSADGDTDVFLVKGEFSAYADGNDGGGTLTWKYLGGDGNYHDLPGAAPTAASLLKFNFPCDCWTKVKGTLSGATGPTLYHEVFANDIKSAS